MHIYHESDIPYIIADKRTNTLKIKLDAENCILDNVSILFGDNYDYENNRDQGWNHTCKEMELRYSTEEMQTWVVEIDIPKWRRIKYSFLLVSHTGEKYLFNEYGCQCKTINEINDLIESYHSHFFYPYIYEEDLISYPDWVSKTVWYQIFPDRFCHVGTNTNASINKNWEDAAPGPDSFYGGDLLGITEKLDYLKELGINGIYLTPVFVAESNHKYDTVNYYEVDPQFGSIETLKDLVEQAHQKEIRVILDGAFNHISSKHPFWQDVLEKQSKSRYKDFFCIRKFPVDSSEEYSKELNYDTFSFVANMPKLNYENPEVKEYIISIIEFWIKECSIDGWRFDVGDELSLSFYNELKQRLKPTKDDIYIVAEIWHDPGRWLRNGYIDAAMNYPMGSAVKEYVIRENYSTKEFNKGYFHLISRLSLVHSTLSFNLLDSHDTQRIMTEADNNKIKVKNAFLMLFLLPGSPCLYYGTEIGLCGRQDPDNRRPMLWDKEECDMELFAFFQRLIAFRMQNSEFLQSARIYYKELHGINIWKFSDENSCYLLLHNQTDDAIDLSGCKVLFTSNENGQEVLFPYGMALAEDGCHPERKEGILWQIKQRSI